MCRLKCCLLAQENGLGHVNASVFGQANLLILLDGGHDWQ